MRAIKIDSENMTVHEIEIDEERTLSQLQGIVGGNIELAHELPEGDSVFVNEEGLFCSPEHFFEINGGHQPFAGNGVVVGLDFKSGSTVGAKSSVENIRSLVKFLKVKDIAGRF